MTSDTIRRAQRGFTLIELMVVVAIIGVLASIAIPSFERLTIKSKAAERPELILRLKKAVDDLYLQNGSIPGGLLVADFQPALPLSSGRRTPNWRTPGWSDLLKTGEEILGATYYSYQVTAWEQDGSTPPGFELRVLGDLDGDGVPSDIVIDFERVGGIYRQTFPTPTALTDALNNSPY